MQQTKIGTSTQIRNFYSEGYAYLNMKFYNTALSLSFAPFLSKDPTGRSSYDVNNSLLTTIAYDSAFAIYQVCNDILSEKLKTVNLIIPCNGATLVLDRKLNNANQYETLMTITKNNQTVAFKFQTIPIQVKDDNGVLQTKMVENGLGAFMKTLEGYLVGINADRHLDKLTDDYARQLNNNNAQMGNRNNGMNNNRPNYQNNNGYRNNNYRNNKPQYKPRNNNWNGGGGGPSQNFNNYSLQN